MLSYCHMKFAYHYGRLRGCHGRDCIIGGFTTTCAISFYHL